MDVKRTDFCWSEYCPSKYCSIRKLYNQQDPLAWSEEMDLRSNLSRGRSDQGIHESLSGIVEIINVVWIIEPNGYRGQIYRILSYNVSPMMPYVLGGIRSTYTIRFQTTSLL